jgi:YfiH family protein
VTDRSGLLLGVLTADCGPVLLADREAGVIGAAHAGWKGALGGVLEGVVAAMSGLGARTERIAAVVGPCIAQSSYEVGPEFIARFTDVDPGNARYFMPNGDRALFDLKAYIALRLRATGIERVDVMRDDTCADAGRFFSYRRATLRREESFGLQLSAIILEG